jgi:sulfide:quinone oxidoreductase
MIESMVTAAAINIRDVLKGTKPSHKVTSNSLCLAEFGDEGVAFAAMPQIPPRQVHWASIGTGLPEAKVGFERYFIHKVRHSRCETFYEKQILKWISADKPNEEA